MTKSKAIWLIAGGPMQAGIVSFIKKQGYKLILSDASTDCYCRESADVFFAIDTFDAKAHLQALKAIRDDIEVVAVFTASADCHNTVSVLARALDLPGLPPGISEICRHKIKLRDLLTSAGIRQPWSVATTGLQEARDFWTARGGQSVLKSTDSSGSRGFQALEHPGELDQNKFDYTKSHGSTGLVILEERLMPDSNQISESSVETIWADGKMYWLNWVDRIFGRDLHLLPQLIEDYKVPDGIELAHLNPARRAPNVKKEVHAQMLRAGKALGLDRTKGAHILKGDIFFAVEGPVILELTPRASGGWDSCGSSLLRGAKVHQGLLQLAMGKKLDLDLWTNFFSFELNEINVAVLAQPAQNAVDCIGRKFAMSGSLVSMADAIEGARRKIKQGDYIVPIL